MKKQYPVMWFEGMPVGPTMFQQNHLYIEKLFRIHNKMANNFAWGIIESNFDLSNLADGHFKLASLLALNENGFLFQVDESYDLKLNLKDFQEMFKNDKEFYIYLSMPKNEYTNQQNENNPKYSIDYQEVEDLNNKHDKNGISFLKPNYSLELAETSSLRSESLPLAKVKFNGMAFNLSKYTYPTQKISNTTGIVKGLKELVIKMKDKLKYLKSIKKNDLEQYAQLSNLSNVLFGLEAGLKSDDHPFNIYKLLAQGAGSFFNFSSSKDLPIVEPYNHTDMAAAIYPLIEYIDMTLNTIFEAFKINKFTRNQNSFEFSLNEINTDYLLIAIHKTGAMTYEDLTNWMASIVIATADKLEKIKEQRSRGANRFKIDNYEELGVQELTNMILFKVQVQKECISPNEVLCLFNNDTSLANPSSVSFIEK